MTLTQNYIEFAAMLSGVLNVYLVTRINIWNWFFGIITVTLYAYLFYSVGLYADMSLQVVYLALQFYGWQQWQDEDNVFHTLKIKKTPRWLWLFLLAAILFLFISLSYLLEHYTDSSTVKLDALTTAISLIAQWMMCKKRLENWWLWMVVDTIYLEMYWEKQLYMTCVLYFIYLILCIVGYKTWSARLPAQSKLD
jgi:nicotinamide mononucleotide transporter